MNTRRDFMKLGGLAVAAAALLPGEAVAASAAPDAPTSGMAGVPASGMDTLTAIHTRRSIRAFKEEAVSDEAVRILLAAGMAAPSAGNEQPWEFVVIRDPEILAQVGSINRFAGFAQKSPVSILTCVNEERVKHAGYGILDVSACTQNILLAAQATGLGAVWTGIYPQQDRVEGFRKLLGIPDTVIPLALVVLGHPASKPRPQDRFDINRIHAERW